MNCETSETELGSGWNWKNKFGKVRFEIMNNVKGEIPRASQIPTHISSFC